MGNHFIDLPNFRELTDLSLVNPLKFGKNSKSTTANIRMLFSSSEVESLESKLDSGVESTKLDSRDSKDSTPCVESSNNNPHEVGTLKACSGEEGVVKGGEGATLRLSRTPFSPFEDEKIGISNLVEDSKGLVNSTLDSKLFIDSNMESPLDSRIFNKYSNFKPNLDSRASIPLIREVA